MVFVEVSSRDDDRPTYMVAGGVIPIEWARRDFCSVRVAAEAVIEPIVGIEAFMAVKPSTTAVKFACSILCRDYQLATGGIAVFGLIVGGKDFDFGDCVRIDCDVQRAIIAGIDIGRAVNGELVLIAAGSIDIECIQAATVRDLPVKFTDYTGNHFHKVDDVAAVKRQTIELFRSNQVGTLARVGLQLQLSTVGCDSDRLVSASHFESKIPGITPVSGA